MMMKKQRAAIYIGCTSHPMKRNAGMSEQQREACCRYCEEQGYQFSEQHLYQNENEPFWSDAPPLVRLRMAVALREFDVLVILSSECLGVLPLWRSLPTANTVSAFYKHEVCIESVIKRYGTHDIYRQMLYDAYYFVKQLDEKQIEPGHLYKRNDPTPKRPPNEQP